MTLAYVGLGANLGDPAGNVRRAVRAVARLPGVTRIRSASLYQSSPVGVVDQPEFVNSVVEIETDASALELLRALKALERDLGRVPGVRWGPRVIDLDLLLFGDAQADDPELTLPHPQMWRRRFVLEPLAELRPDVRAPDGERIDAVLSRLDPTQVVRRLDSVGGSSGDRERADGECGRGTLNGC